MIDTDKYEGHTPAPWGGTCQAPWTVVDIHEGSSNAHPDMKLIYGAPLLLAEVKRLRGLLLEIWKHANECSEEPAEMDETLSAIARALMKEDMR